MSKQSNIIKPKMNNPNFQSSFLSSLVDKLCDRDVAYCILRNYRRLPREILSKDVDILIDGRNLAKAVAAMKEIAIEKEAALLSFTDFQYVKSFTLVKIEDNEPLSIKIDFFFNFEYRGAKLLDGDRILSCARPYNKFRVVDSVQEAIMLWLNPLISGSIIKQIYVKKVVSAAKRRPAIFRAYMEQILGRALTARLWPFVHSGNIEATLKYHGSIRAKSWLRGLMREPFGVLGRLAAHLYIEIRKAFSMDKRMIVVIGPDGVGKSTLVHNLRHSLAEVTKEDLDKVKVFHFRPNLLPNLKRLLISKIDYNLDVFAEPHRKEPSGFVGSLLRFSYYYIDYTLGYCVEIWPLHRKKHIVLFDRYYYDFIVDPARSRLSIPQFIPFLLSKFVPHPTITVLMESDADTIFKRKQELSRVEIRRQIGEYRMLAKRMANTIVVDSRAPIEEITRKVSLAYVERIAIPAELIDGRFR